MTKNIIIIGSSHIAKQSLNEVKEAILTQKPDIVAIELDKSRAFALMNNVKRANNLTIIRSVGLKGFLFSFIGSIAQKKLGNLVGVEPGSEMKTALVLSQKNNLKVALIDQDIQITLRKFSRYVTWKEKWFFVVDLVNALLGRGTKLQFDLKKVPEDELISKLMNELKGRYPNVHKVLVDDRNIIMAKRLYRLSNDNPNKTILAIIGAGHKKEIKELLEKYDKEN